MPAYVMPVWPKGRTMISGPPSEQVPSGCWPRTRQPAARRLAIRAWYLARFRERSEATRESSPTATSAGMRRTSRGGGHGRGGKGRGRSRPARARGRRGEDSAHKHDIRAGALARQHPTRHRGLGGGIVGITRPPRMHQHEAASKVACLDSTGNAAHHLIVAHGDHPVDDDIPAGEAAPAQATVLVAVGRARRQLAPEHKGAAPHKGLEADGESARPDSGGQRACAALPKQVVRIGRRAPASQGAQRGQRLASLGGSAAHQRAGDDVLQRGGGG